MKKIVLLCLTLFLASASLQAQYVYPERFEDNCYLDEFEYESTEIIAKLDESVLIETITQGWSEKMIKGAEGNLGMQILVDERGRSCLVSVRNDTNLKLKKLNLIENVGQLKWNRLSEKISAIVVFVFEEGEIQVKRLGTTDQKTLTEINP